jgi:hypothetical protein
MFTSHIILINNCIIVITTLCIVFNRFKMWTGFGGGMAGEGTDPAIKDGSPGKPNVEEQIEDFPQRIDRLLASISHMYMEKTNMEAIIEKSAYGNKMAMKKMFDAHPSGHYTGNDDNKAGPSGSHYPGNDDYKMRGLTQVQTH